MTAVNIRLLYSDIEPNMALSWNRDVSASTGSAAIKNSIVGIIMTQKGTRPFDPDFGCAIDGQLFENMSPLVVDTIKTSIIDAIAKYEPRVSSLTVDVNALYDMNAVTATIYFSIIDNPDDLELIKLQLSA